MPRKPTDKTVIEAFSDRFRQECLKASWFLSLAEARAKIAARRRQPHSSLGRPAPRELTVAEQEGRPSLPPDQFLNPLDVIWREHERQHLLSDWLSELANSLRPDPVVTETATLLSYLTQDLPLHLRDEDEDLFPMLKHRCRPEDGFGRIMAQLSYEHALDKVLVCHIVIDLKEIASETVASPNRLFISLHTFAEVQRRHLAWENGVVLPLACKRLSPKDLEEMGRNMAARRGISYPG